MKSYKIPYSIVLVVALVIIGFVGSSLIVNSASEEEIITIATLEYHPWTGKNMWISSPLTTRLGQWI